MSHQLSQLRARMSRCWSHLSGPRRLARPNADVTREVMSGRLALLDTSDINWDRIAKLAEGLSHAELSMACEQAAKNAILANTTAVSDAELALAVEERRSTHI